MVCDALAKQSARKRAKSQSVKHIPKGRLEEATAELDSQLAQVQALYAVRVYSDSLADQQWD